MTLCSLLERNVLENELECIEAGESADRVCYGDEAVLPLLKSSNNFVQILRKDRCLTDAYRALPGDKDPDEELALMTPPVMLEVQLPPDYRPGEAVRLPGPHSTIEVEGPPETKPGEWLTYYLGPLPEFRVEVPQGALSHSRLRFTKEDDGSQVEVVVPKGLGPGDVFEVEPPAMMVLVPKLCKPGKVVRFEHFGVTWRARVPQTLRQGYFAARLNQDGQLPQSVDDELIDGHQTFSI